ncbi:MAG TPA: hypothetical protein VHP31_06780 [Caproicibacter sp.]|nr:hypothetical protein [Caproicibacter sp.]
MRRRTISIEALCLLALLVLFWKKLIFALLVVLCVMIGILVFKGVSSQKPRP